MDSAYLQQQRFQLQKRFRRLNSCDFRVFHSNLVQVWNYLWAQPLTAGVLAKLKSEASPFSVEVNALVQGRATAEFSDEQQMASFVFRVVEHCVALPLGDSSLAEVNIGRTLCREPKHNDALNGFREIVLEPFYEFLDEALDQQAAVLSLLVKYRRKVEWFERARLSGLVDKGERELARHLYAYLFDQGLDFHIEPHSASGEADLVAKDLVLDAKVFDGTSSRGARYLRAGVQQVHAYARDFNQASAYLVIYKTCQEAIDFEEASANSAMPHIVVGGKTVYLLVVDICHYDASASKRGPLKVHTVPLDSLVLTAEELASELPAQTMAP